MLLQVICQYTDMLEEGENPITPKSDFLFSTTLTLLSYGQLVDIFNILKMQYLYFGKLSASALLTVLHLSLVMVDVEGVPSFGSTLMTKMVLAKHFINSKEDLKILTVEKVKKESDYVQWRKTVIPVVNKLVDFAKKNGLEKRKKNSEDEEKVAESIPVEDKESSGELLPSINSVTLRKRRNAGCYK